MAVLDSELVNIDNDIKNAQSIKNTVLEVLFADGKISEKDIELYGIKYQIIFIKRSWWNDWKDIFGKSSTPGYSYRFLKIN